MPRGGGASGSGGDAKEDEAAAAAAREFDWANFSVQAKSFMHSAWGEIKESSNELFKIDKDETVLKKKVHGARPVRHRLL